MIIKKICFALLASIVLYSCISCNGQENLNTVTSNPEDDMATDVAFIEQSVNATLAANQPQSAGSGESSDNADTPMTPTFTLAPSPMLPPTATINVYEAIIWAGPGEDYPIVIKGAKGETYEVVGKSEDSEWLIVQVDEDRQGWVLLDEVKTNVELSELAAIDVPPTPEVTLAPTQSSVVTITIINNTQKGVNLHFNAAYPLDLKRGVAIKPGNQYTFKLPPGTYSVELTAAGQMCVDKTVTLSQDILWIVTDSFTCGQSPFQ